MAFELEMNAVSSLEKVFPDSGPADAFKSSSALQGETFSFQIAYRAPSLVKRLHAHVKAGKLPAEPSLFRVGLVPSELPGYGDEDDFVLKTTPGLYPDPLFPLTDTDELYAYPDQWRALFCEVYVLEGAEPGIYPIYICLSGRDDSTFGYQKEWHGEVCFTLTVLPAKLPKLDIPHTEWFFTDCIATYYKMEVFSEAWWSMVGKYIENAVSHGINTILTPLFTPPLETAVGAERETVQLVSVTKTGSRYDFGFEKLERWIKLCLECGVEYFEMPHLFTQWGAEFTPKILVEENGQEKKLFGWHIRSDSGAYHAFLEQFLPAVVSLINRYVEKDHVFFHISDEPSEAHAPQYEDLSRFVAGLVDGCLMIDAMSSLEVYRKSYISAPVAAIDEIAPFIDDGIENLWAYYACLQNKSYITNRFFCFPSNRNRILGIQLYKYKLCGFLQWGYNHWYSGLSVKEIDPFRTTDADACFPSGDAFLVYPGREGPVNSLRIAVLREAFQDMMALRLLETFVGRAKTIGVLEEGIPPITFTDYPHETKWLLDARERVNTVIADQVCKRKKGRTILYPFL